jgi:hypothetical protein
MYTNHRSDPLVPQRVRISSGSREKSSYYTQRPEKRGRGASSERRTVLTRTRSTRAAGGEVDDVENGRGKSQKTTRRHTSGCDIKKRSIHGRAVCQGRPSGGQEAAGGREEEGKSAATARRREAERPETARRRDLSTAGQMN